MRVTHEWTNKGGSLVNPSGTTRSYCSTVLSPQFSMLHTKNPEHGTHCPQNLPPSYEFKNPSADIHLGLWPNSIPNIRNAHLNVSLSPPHMWNQKSLSACISAAMSNAARLRPPLPALSITIWPDSKVNESRVHVSPTRRQMALWG